MSSSAPESSSSQGPSDFQLAGSEKLRKPRWKLDNLPDLTGKVIMVTNPNNKVGKDTAKALLYHNATVYIASSNVPKAEGTVAELKKETGKNPIFLHLDLADKGNCLSAAQLFLQSEKELHAIYNSGHIIAPGLSSKNFDDYDMLFSKKVISHVHFIELVMPALVVGAKKSSRSHKSKKPETSEQN
ncbi:hypothetical protein BJ322DRAFT_1053007 [Thelephora terrestris]|uniref:Uncharacterized protein n=1 Tax=Thelephora terrestris TaxID=56493 RepID=A0A9P6L8P3_9AGAM|nr:hypothetical protein BJ322DRAFT_1053007 [Thelephora terrestris]